MEDYDKNHNLVYLRGIDNRGKHAHERAEKGASRRRETLDENDPYFLRRIRRVNKYTGKEMIVFYGKCIRCGETAELYFHSRWCVPCSQLKRREFTRKLKDDILEHYGKECACCGEKHKEFLTIDHINGGGSNHRKELSKWGRGGEPVYSWLKKNGYPAGFRVLCTNCNTAMGFLGKCPHETEREIQNKETSNG